MMLTLLDRLIARHVLYGTLLVLNVLVALAVFFILIDGLKDYGKASFGALALVKYVILKQPQQVYELSPIAALIGAMMGLSTMALNSELTAMRAAGAAARRSLISARFCPTSACCGRIFMILINTRTCASKPRRAMRRMTATSGG